MKLFKKQKITINEINSIICDNCQKEAKKEDIERFDSYFNIHYNSKAVSQWELNKLNDIDLCSECFYKIFKKMLKEKTPNLKG